MAGGSIDSRVIWAIAIPAMITNVATALIGVADLWIVGRLGSAPPQGAVDIGARLFALLFTVMNFLKTGTTGMVAQAGARSGPREQAATLLRGIAVALVIAFTLLALKPILLPLLLAALGAEGAVLEAANIYAGIRYWSAPGVLVNLALIGYLVGQRRMKAVLVIEVGYNLLNVALGLFFVLRLDMGIAGIGWSSLIAEYAKLAVTAAIVLSGGGAALLRAATRDRVLVRDKLQPFLSVNRDLFLRTVILSIALAALTRIGAERGPVILAANAILFQFFLFSALFLDGFENAAQVLNGEAKGAADRVRFERLTRAILLRGIAAAALVSLFFGAFAVPLIKSFAATPEVAAAAMFVSPWLVLMPFAGVASFIYDGVYVGASWTRALLLTMVGGTLVYALSLWATWSLGNHGLWLSFTLFLAARALFQRLALPRLTRRIDHDPTLEKQS
ncbi:MATE family efflux transporter [Sphingomicrobium astaxanthinifaciens]|uniref:MATE family efflux transporter n=1 Tax=Sphingomicrobium astaxanthinifaciens TaxID=1227949 RepID=UPI001FCB25B0|nr:MATE family efflux transporter [Sphingomicrobium astaxanthinifaciens]MCJ7420976.1 MATE family efflux transporter [Sphingomicrobium astaxanthinifaciens]